MTKESFKWQSISIIVAFLLGIYLLIPTVLHLEEKRAALQLDGGAAPWYYSLLPEKALRLGLDLQGGIYVEMEVGLEAAIQHKTNVYAEEISLRLKEEGGGTTTTTQPALGELEMTFDKAASFDAVEKILNRSYRKVLVVRSVENRDTQPKIHVGLTQEWRDYLSNNIVEQATDSVRNRINRYGVGEPDIRRQGRDRIAIELPGLKDPDRAIDLIKRTGQLEFRLVHEVATPQALASQQAQLQVQIAEARKSANIPENDWSLSATHRLNDALKGKIPAGTEVFFQLIRNEKNQVTRGVPYVLEDKASVTGDMLTDASVAVHENRPQVAFAMDKSGAKIFGELTKNNVNHFFAIILDGTVMSAPAIEEPILSGSGVIRLGSGNYDAMNREAHDLSLILQEGALPASLTEAKKNIIGPSLGADLIRQGFTAAAVASIGVIIFMILYYRMAGVLADVALMLNLLLMFAILSLFDATLTMPGIAGIVLTIGMAVDANVIINERIREELREGKSMRDAIHEGYAHANRAIIDSNMSTLIAGLVLYQFGADAIKGFAVTLCVGILTTLFTAVIGTRVTFELCFVRWRMRMMNV